MIETVQLPPLSHIYQLETPLRTSDLHREPHFSLKGQRLLASTARSCGGSGRRPRNGPQGDTRGHRRG